jgi:hypothetical protein
MTFCSTPTTSLTIAIWRFLLKNKSGGEMPRKKTNRDFIIAGYRRIAQDKKPSAIQLRALDRLAVICGLIKLRSQNPVDKPADEIVTPVGEVDNEDGLEDFMNFHKGKARRGDYAATEHQSPSGQPDVSSN